VALDLETGEKRQLSDALTNLGELFQSEGRLPEARQKKTEALRLQIEVDRAGESQTTTAMTILTHLPKVPQSAAALLGESRRILVSQFDNLHPFSQEYLLRQYWDQLRDPSLVPSLKKMLGNTGFASKNIHDSALKRLLEIAPDEARPFVVSEIRNPTSLVDLEILSSLTDKSLPEVDEALLEQIRRFASSTTNLIESI